MAKKKTNEVNVTAPVVEEPTVKSEVVEARKLDNDTLVPCLNMTNGKLIYKSSRTNIKFTWGNPGDVLELSYGELKDMSSAKAKFLRDCMIFILDEDVVKGLRLTDVYKNVMSPEQIEELLSMNEDEIKSRIKSAPKTVQELVYFKARTSLSDMTIGRKRAVEEALGVTLGDE